MNSFGIVSDMMSIRLTVVLAHFLWQGCLIGSLVALLARVFGRAPAQTRYVVLVAGLVAMGACPVVTFFAIVTVGAPHSRRRTKYQSEHGLAAQYRSTIPASATWKPFISIPNTRQSSSQSHSAEPARQRPTRFARLFKALAPYRCIMPRAFA